MFDETALKTTDDQRGHLISKVENCRSNLVQKLDLDALANLVDDHATLIRYCEQPREGITPEPQESEACDGETAHQEITLPRTDAPRKVTIIIE